ncbi:MAG: hypothetical protein R3Y11_03740 [Pseudomonadota bacterium]
MTTNSTPVENGQTTLETDAQASLKIDAQASLKTDAQATLETDAQASLKIDAQASLKTDAQKNPNATEIDPVTGFRRPPTISVHLQPEEQIFEMPRVKSAGQLLKKLGFRQATALVVRDGELLTPDRPINHGDHILVRGITSRG